MFYWMLFFFIFRKNKINHIFHVHIFEFVSINGGALTCSPIAWIKNMTSVFSAVVRVWKKVHNLKQKKRYEMYKPITTIRLKRIKMVSLDYF